MLRAPPSLPFSWPGAWHSGRPSALPGAVAAPLGASSPVPAGSVAPVVGRRGGEPAVVVAAALGVCALSRSRGRLRRERRQRAPSASRAGGLAPSFPLRRQRRRGVLRATPLDEAQQWFAKEAIEAAVRAVDGATGKPGEEAIEDDEFRESYVSQQRPEQDGAHVRDEVDEDGLPVVYNVKKLNEFWGRSFGELASRWTDFLRVGTPWIARAFAAVVTRRLAEEERQLARDAVDNMQRLGPTFIKLGQVLSIRPDVLSPVVMQELGRLQDQINTFDSNLARSVLAKELGRPIGEVFSELSEEPVAAASLAQVYRGRLRDSGIEVAVKVQRPGALALIGKDLYVMRKAASVVNELARRVTSQLTDFRAVVEAFGEGLYTELDFRNEAMNQMKMKKLVDETPECSGVCVPSVYTQYTTRRILVSDWVDGTKLTDLPAERIKAGIPDAQRVFLHQLLNWGFFHGDPHPGNLLYVNSGPNKGKLCLLDFGLVVQIPPKDRESIMTGIVHVGTKNWEGLTDDFIKLGFLPANCQRGVIIPAMQRVLSPYLRGGGAKALNFKALGQDLLQATMEIPFSIPPSISLLARSIATLEGVALAGDPGYRIVGEAYPFVVRRLLQAPGGSSWLSSALRDLLLDGSGRVRPMRLSALLQAAVGVAASSGDQDGFIDFDAVPKDSAGAEELVAFLRSPGGENLKPLLVKEFATVIDLVVRSTTRQAFFGFQGALRPRVPLLGVAIPLPRPPPVPVVTPSGPKLLAPEELLDALQPKLEPDEEMYLQSGAQVFLSLLGVQVDPDKGVDINLSPRRVVQVLTALASQRDEDMTRVLGDLLKNRNGRQLVLDWGGDLAALLRDLFFKRLGEM